MNTDHIIANAKTQELKCLHCGATEPLLQNVPVIVVCFAFKAFQRRHQRCKKPEVPHGAIPG